MNPLFSMASIIAALQLFPMAEYGPKPSVRFIAIQTDLACTTYRDHEIGRPLDEVDQSPSESPCDQPIGRINQLPTHADLCDVTSPTGLDGHSLALQTDRRNSTITGLTPMSGRILQSIPSSGQSSNRFVKVCSASSKHEPTQPSTRQNPIHPSS